MKQQVETHDDVIVTSNESRGQTRNLSDVARLHTCCRRKTEDSLSECAEKELNPIGLKHTVHSASHRIVK